MDEPIVETHANRKSGIEERKASSRLVFRRLWLGWKAGRAGRPGLVTTLMKILVAEDEPISSKYLTGVLRKLGHEFVATRNGHEALSQFLTYQPAVVISDWMMPTMDGIELCQQIRGMGLEQYTFFILQTAKSGRADYLRAMDAGVDDFLSKPVNHEEIAIRLRVAERIWSASAPI